MPESLLRVEQLRKYFPVSKGLFSHRASSVIKAIDGIDFTINPKETFALVGESGCGKTTTGRAILRLEGPTDGHVFFQGKDVSQLGSKNLKDYHCSVQAVFQDPTSSLNPRMRIDTIVTEPISVNKRLPNSEIKSRMFDILKMVGLDREAVKRYPHEFSGGQRQRIALARALSSNPKLVVLDEPVSALDVSIGAQIMNLLKELQEQTGVAYLLIAHNLATVRYVSHEMGVMYLGKIVESGASEEVFSHHLHPYTQALISAALTSHPDVKRQRIVLTGEVPSPINVPSGCRFHTRCFRAMPKCSCNEPILKSIGKDHKVACFLY